MCSSDLSAVWVRQSTENYNWLYVLFHDLIAEYGYRYEKQHATGRLLGLLARMPRNLPAGPFTQPTQAMPDEYKRDDAVEAYRAYYRGAKTHLLKYKKREEPYWLESQCVELS